MSFDWRAFATGFFEETGEIQKENIAEAKQFEEDQRAAVERNAAVISRRRAIADQVTGYANYLQRNGVSDAQFQAAVASGPEAVVQLTEAVRNAVEANNGRPLSSSDVDALIRMPPGFTPLDMSNEEFIRRTYGLSTGEAADTEQREFSFMDRVLGRDRMARAEDRLDATPYMEGMTIRQINEAAKRSDYESLIPGTFITFAEDRSYNIVDQGPEFLRDFNRLLDDTESSDRFNSRAIQTRLETAGAADTGVDAIEAEQQRMRVASVDPLIRGYAEQDPVGFMSAHEEQLRNRLGDAYVEQLKEDLGLSAPEPEEEEVTGGGNMGGNDTVTTPAPQPSVMTETPTMTAPRAENTDIESEAETVDINIPEPTADTAVQVEDGETYTYAEWQEMSREERREAGLPLGEGAAQIYFNRFGTGVGTFTPIEDMVGPAGEGDPEQTRIYEELSSQGVDDVSIALLNSQGSDMLDYVISKDATTEADILMALTEWGQENNIVMPFDKSALIVALKSVIDNQ